MTPPILIIAGMHRSGTSLTASMLQSAGLNIGQNLISSDYGNPKGYYENRDFLKFHERVLFSLGIDTVGWTLNRNLSPPGYHIDEAKKLIEKNASLTGPWGWKEPRTTLFLDFWAKLLPQANFLLLYRRPWEILDSLYRRGDQIFHYHPEFALQVWQSYNQILWDFSQTHPNRCLLANINQIIDDRHWLVQTLREKFELLLGEPDFSLYDRDFFCRDLDPHQPQSQRPLILKHHFPEAFELYLELNRVSGYRDPLIEELEKFSLPSAWILQDWLDLRLLQNKLEEGRQAQAECDRSLQQLSGQLEGYRGQVQSQAAQIQELQQQLDDTQQHLKRSRRDLEGRQQDLNQTQMQLKRAEEAIAAMETSKFWQMRKLWFKLKRSLGIKSE